MSLGTRLNILSNSWFWGDTDCNLFLLVELMVNWRFLVRYPPRGMVGINISLQIFLNKCPQKARTIITILVSNVNFQERDLKSLSRSIRQTPHSRRPARQFIWILTTQMMNTPKCSLVRSGWGYKLFPNRVVDRWHRLCYCTCCLYSSYGLGVCFAHYIRAGPPLFQPIVG